MNDAIDFTASKPDPRVWLFLILVVSLLTFPCGSRLELFLLFAALALIMLWQRMFAAVISCAVFYLVLLVLNQFLWLIAIAPVKMVAGMLIVLFFRLMPVYMAYIILLEKTSMNELLAALEQMHIPHMLIIPLAVVYRYLPTVRYEIMYIKDSLKMRGLNPSLTGILFHPVTMVEKFMIPLLIRSAKLADELSAAALCKGLDTNYARTSCTGVRFAQKDAACCVFFALAAGALIFWHYYPDFASLVL